jgi:hypothetical protein
VPFFAALEVFSYWCFSDIFEEMGLIPTPFHNGKADTRLFLRHLYIKCMILPRQARDKHRENSKRDAFFPGYGLITVNSIPKPGEMKTRKTLFCSALLCSVLLCSVQFSSVQFGLQFSSEKEATICQDRLGTNATETSNKTSTVFHTAYRAFQLLHDGGNARIPVNVTVRENGLVFAISI